MKKLVISLLVIAAFVVAPMSLFAQTTSVTLQSTAKASILSSIAVSNETSGGATSDAAFLNFGLITKGASDGSVTIAPDGTVSSSVVALIGTNRNPASFKVTGSVGASFAVAIPSTISLTGPSGSTPIVVNTVTQESSTGYTIDAGGEKYFHVGGTLPVTSTQADGAYSANFNVTVAYN